MDKLLITINNWTLPFKPLPQEYNYSCIPLAVIDAVYSVRLRYSTTVNIVNNYCNEYGIGVYKNDSNKKVHTISDLIGIIEKTGTDVFLRNDYKTAGANPMLKSKAVYEFAKVLKENNIECFEDFRSADVEKLEKELLKIHGQGQAVVRYFFMLCGDDSFCKYDTHIKNFLDDINANVKNADEAQEFLTSVVKELKAYYPDMTVRMLDYIIWDYQRNRG